MEPEQRRVRKRAKKAAKASKVLVDSGQCVLLRVNVGYLLCELSHVALTVSQQCEEHPQALNHLKVMIRNAVNQSFGSINEACGRIRSFQIYQRRSQIQWKIWKRHEKT